MTPNPTSRPAARPTRGGSTRVHAIASRVARPGDVVLCPTCGGAAVLGVHGELLERRPIRRHDCERFQA